MGKYGRARKATRDSIKWCMRITWWITKAMDTHLRLLVIEQELDVTPIYNFTGRKKKVDRSSIRPALLYVTSLRK